VSSPRPRAFLERRACADRDAVVAALTECCDLVAGLAQRGEREIRVLDLGLLQAQDVGALAFDPAE
jgi:hypothetical protein